MRFRLMRMRVSVLSLLCSLRLVLSLLELVLVVRVSVLVLRVKELIEDSVEEAEDEDKKSCRSSFWSPKAKMAPERPRCPSPSNTLMPFPGPWASLAFSGVKPKMDRASSAQDVSFLAVGEPNGPWFSGVEVASSTRFIWPRLLFIWRLSARSILAARRIWRACAFFSSLAAASAAFRSACSFNLRSCAAFLSACRRMFFA
mmetsp:Transcript_8114/g.21642  ORF Transcript_8114/g.21642 Transcript_8114/m.21642 type:complete len:201 (-) Transcript_8114:1366-1968(-)